MQQLCLFEKKDAISEALGRSLMSFSGAEKRWKRHTRKGLSDQALAEAIAYEFGIWGGGLQESLYYEVSGRSGNPIFTFYPEPEDLKKKQQLSGKPLLNRVRDLKSVPFP